MKKADMVNAIVNSTAWNGADEKYLMKLKKDEVKDIYDMLDKAEEDYYLSTYGY